jgi:hypothetical protein
MFAMSEEDGWEEVGEAIPVAGHLTILIPREYTTGVGFAAVGYPKLAGVSVILRALCNPYVTPFAVKETRGPVPASFKYGCARL